MSLALTPFQTAYHSHTLQMSLMLLNPTISVLVSAIVCIRPAGQREMDEIQISPQWSRPNVRSQLRGILEVSSFPPSVDESFRSLQLEDIVKWEKTRRVIFHV